MVPDGEGNKVGKFLAILSRNSIQIGFVTQVTMELPEVAREQGYIASARVDLMGEIKADAAGYPNFLRGITEYPLIGDPVVAVAPNELRVIYGSDELGTIKVGQLQHDETLSGCIRVNEVLTRH